MYVLRAQKHPSGWLPPPPSLSGIECIASHVSYLYRVCELRDEDEQCDSIYRTGAMVLWLERPLRSRHTWGSFLKPSHVKRL